MSFKIISLKWYHDGNLIGGPFPHYVGGNQTIMTEFDVDKISFFELMDYTRDMGLKNVAELYICPMDRIDKLVNIVTDKDVLDITNQLEDGDTLNIYVTHAPPLAVIDTSPRPSRNVNDVEEIVDLTAGGDPVDESDSEESSDGEDEKENDSDYDNSSSEESDGVDLDVPDDNNYGSDVHEEFAEVREELRKYKRRRRSERPKDKNDINLGDAGVDIGFDELRTGSKVNRYAGLVGTDEPYFGSSEAESFASDVEDEFSEEHRRRVDEKIRKRNLVFDPTAKKITWELGLIFESVQQFRYAVSCYAIQKGVQLEKYINEPKRVRVRCLRDGCPWMLAASLHKRSNNFKIKKYNPVHKCYKTNKNRFCNSNWLAKYYRKDIVSTPNMKVWELKKKIKEELDMYVGRSTVHRARAKILKEIIGDVHEEFRRILDYRDILLETNPGTTCVVKTVDKGEGRLQFQSFYVCFHAMKKGWLEGCRRIIGMDGCFLKGMCRGQLLAAVSKDGNNQMFPIAWAVVEVENTATWSWFVKCLIHDLHLEEGAGLTIMSDMQKGLINAVKDLLPAAEHRMCARHVLANWSKNWRGLERRNNFWRCARSSCVAELNTNLEELDKLGDEICESLLLYKKETWCRAYQKEDVQCDVIDNNMCETFNAWILAERHKTIITMLEEIRVKMMERVAKLREFPTKWPGEFSLVAMKVFQDNAAHSMQCTLTWNGDKGFEVLDDKYKHTVNFEDYTCTCRAFQLKGIPCAHSIAAFHHRNMNPLDFMAHWYHKSTYMKAYSTFIQPVTNMKMWPATNNPPIEPPPIRKLPGRPKKSRRKEETEHPKHGKLSKRGMEMTCSNCKGLGHNKRGCPKSPMTFPATTAAGRGRGSSGNAAGRGRGSSGNAAGRGRGSSGSSAGRGRGNAASVSAGMGSGAAASASESGGRGATASVGGGRGRGATASVGGGRGRGASSSAGRGSFASWFNASGSASASCGRGRAAARGRGSSGIGLYQGSKGFSSFSTGTGTTRVINAGVKRDSAAEKECAFQPKKKALKWNGRPAITRTQLQRNAAASHSMNTQGSSSAMPSNHN